MAELLVCILRLRKEHKVFLISHGDRNKKLGYAFSRGQKINANFFCTKFFKNPSGHGRPRQKSWTSAPKVRFSAAPVMGRNFLTRGRPGVRVRNVRGKSGPKSLCLCCFFFPDSQRFDCGWFEKGSLRKLCHGTFVCQSFLAATLIAASHCISSCHNQLSIESLWNDCPWLQAGRQCNHSISTLQLSTATHSTAHNDPPTK